jgi:ankyrin repeat protein
MSNLEEACTKGHLDDVRYIVNSSIEAAVTNGRIDIVEYFAAHRFDLDPYFHLACESGDMAMIRYLLKVVDELDDDIIYYACRKGDMDMLCLLLNAGAKLWPESLAVAAAGGHNDMIEFLIKYGADVEYQEDEWNSLFFACQNNHVETVKLLLDYDVPIITDSRGNYCYDVTDNEEIKALFQEY